MAVSAAVSVASFSVVLAEAFAAVAVSTLVPATFLSVARAAKAAAANANVTEGDGFIGNLPGVGVAVEALKSASKRITDIDLLVPKTAKIHGEFEFQGGESLAAGASLGGQVQVVTVSAGYSMLYQSTSRNKITLDVDFAAVNYTL